MNKKLYWVLIVLFSAIFLVSATFVVKYIIESYQSQEQHKQLQEMHTKPTSNPDVTLRPATKPTTPNGTTVPPTTGPTQPSTVPPTTGPTQPPSEPSSGSGMLPDLEALYNLNNDVVGYIYIEGTNVNYPVLQRKSQKDYYLYRDFYGNDDRHGFIYVREACDVFRPSDNVTIYGHNMADATMFAHLHRYKDKEYFDANSIVYFDTLYERHVYQIVCIFRTSGTYGEGFPFHLYDDFKDEAEFKEFINSIRGQDDRVDVVNDSGIAVQYGDKFICLSTCEEWPIENGRLVLVAVRIS